MGVLGTWKFRKPRFLNFKSQIDISITLDGLDNTPFSFKIKAGYSIELAMPLPIVLSAKAPLSNHIQSLDRASLAAERLVSEVKKKGANIATTTLSTSTTTQSET